MSVVVTKDDTEGCLVNQDEYADLWNRVCELEQPCAELVTRTELLALSRSGALDMSCHYAIAKTGNGCLGDVVILMQPVSTSALSANVGVLTGFSPEAWQGTYSINEGSIDSLKDERGNFVSGDNQTEINAFPWGNAGWYNVRVDRATVRTECDTEFRVNDSTFEDASTTDLTGASGRIQRSTVRDGSLLELDGAANVAINALTMDSRSRLYAERTTDLIVTYSSMDSEGYVNLRDRPDCRLIYSRFGSASRVYNSGADRLWLYYVEMSSYGHLRTFSGSVQMYYSSVSSYGEYRNDEGAAEALVYGLEVSSRGFVRNANTNRIRLYHLDVNSRSEARFRGAADAIVYYTHLAGYSILTMEGDATIVYGQQMDSTSRFTVTGGSHYRNRLSSYSRVTTGFDTRNIYADGSFAQTLTAANSSTYRGFGINTLV